MQAIVSDLTLSQVKPSDLQLSQNSNISQNSANSVSFADLVSDLSSRNKIEETKPQEKTEDTPKTDRSSKTDEAKEVKETDKASEEKSLEKSKIVEKTEKNPQDKNQSVEVEDKKSQKLTKDNKTEKNPSKEKAQKEQNPKSELKFAEKIEAADQKVSVNTSNVENFAQPQNVKQDNSKLEIKTEKSEKLDSLDGLKKTSEDKNTELKNPKVTTLDKEGKIVVKDYRTEEKSDEPKNNSKANIKTELKVENQNTATITMDMAQQNTEENVLSLNNQTAGAEGSNYQAMLNNQMQEIAPEFVKAGNIVLKNNNQGTINLVLHPDDLGNVKLTLSLDGKTISGHITVNTKEALEVFKDNAHTLREAFIENGFEGANFDVSYNGSQNSNQNFNGQQYTGNEFLAQKAFGNYIGGNAMEIDDVEINNSISGNYSINIVA